MRKGFCWIVIVATAAHGLLCSGDALLAEEQLANPLSSSNERFKIEGALIEDRDLSAIARGDHGLGIIAADEGSAVQVLEFASDGSGARVRDSFTIEQEPIEIDFEGAAYMDGWYYLTGSHGTSKKRGTFDPSRAVVIRFRLLPDQPGALEIERATLMPILSDDPVLSPFVRRPLQQRGLNIEALAGRDGILIFGLRSPHTDGNAIALAVAADALFSATGAVPPYALHSIPIGDGLGIRAMSAVRDGFLFVAGNAGSEGNKLFPSPVDYQEDRTSLLYFWKPEHQTTICLGQFPPVKKGKEEGLLVLSEMGDGGSAEVLIVYDGVPGTVRRFTVRFP